MHLLNSLSPSEQIETSRRTIKRIKLEVNSIVQSTSEEDPYPRSASPEKGLRVAQPTTPMVTRDYSLSLINIDEKYRVRQLRSEWKRCEI